jgi:AraC-like DNA-binding protein
MMPAPDPHNDGPPLRPPAPPQRFQQIQPVLLRYRYEACRQVRIRRERWPDWLLMWSPQGTLRVAGRPWALDADAVVIIAPHTVFDLAIRASLQEGAPDDYIVRMRPIAHGESARSLARRGEAAHLFAHFLVHGLTYVPACGITRIACTPLLRQLLHRAQAVLQQTPEQTAFDQAATGMLAMVVQECLHQMPRETWTPHRVDARVAELLPWIDEHLAEPLPTAQLAQQVGLPMRTFTRWFREQAGITPQEAVRAARLRKARTLLAEGRLGIAQIAQACGFADRYYFTRIFTDEIGVSPGRYRIRLLGQRL